VDVEWNEQVFPFAQMEPVNGDSSSGLRLILDVDASQRLIDRAEDAHINMTAMMSSPSLGPHKSELVSWMAKLNEISGFLKRWLEVQALWKHLASVFGHHGDELTYEASQFAIFDRDYNKFLLAATECHNILHWCYGSDEDVTKIGLLENLAEGLEGCRKSLSTFLDLKRQEFPRFYFASDAVLLDVISVGIAKGEVVQLPRALQALFSNISSVHIENDEYIVRVESAEGEELAFDSPVMTRPDLNLSSTLSELIQASQFSLKKQIAAASRAAVAVEEGVNETTIKYTNADLDLIMAYATTDSELNTCQAQLIFLRLVWTAMSASAIFKIKLYRHAHLDAKENLDDIVSRFVTDLTRKIASQKVTTNNNAVAIQRLQSLLTLALHLREVTEMVASARCKDQNDFGWLRHMRYIFNEEILDEDEAQPDDQTPGLQLCCADQSLPYNHEYFGVRGSVFITPTTERHILLLTQTMGDIASLQGSILYGSRGTNAARQESVKVVNGLVGNFTLDTMCSELTDGAVLSRLLTGLSRGGVSGCFYNFDKLTLEGMSIFASKLQEIAQRMRANSYATGKAMSANRSRFGTSSEMPLPVNDCLPFSVFISANLVPSNAGPEVPDFIKSSFRSVNFTPPSNKVVITAHCHSCGAFKNPKLVADKIILLGSILNAQLQNEAWYDYGIVTSQRVIQFAASNIRAMKQSKLAQLSKEHLFRRASMQRERTTSTSGSPAAAAARDRDSAPRETIVPALSMTSLPAAPEPVIVDLDTGKQHSMKFPSGISARDAEEFAVATAFIQVYRYRLTLDHQLLFDHAVGKVFQMDSDMLNESLAAPDELRAAFVATTEENSLIPSDQFITKVGEIYSAARKHNSLMLVGPSGSGKTAALTVVLGTLAKFGPVPRVYRINPRALSPSHMFGTMRDSEWVDGIFPTLWRTIEKSAAAEEKVSTFIVFDGPLNDRWLTHLGPILEGKEYFMLGNGDRLVIPPRVKLVFEVSPADLKREAAEEIPAVKLACSINFNSDMVTWEMVTELWLRSRRTSEAAILNDLMRQNDLLESCIKCSDGDHMYVQLPLSGRLDTMFALLTSLLRDSVTAGEVLSKPHIECLLLFSIAWAFGGVLKGKSRERFHAHLKKKSGLVPQDEPTHTIFDYCVTETADWVTWSSEVESLQEGGHPRCEETDFVHTASSACIHFLMDLVIKSGRNVCLVGSRGSGRSSIVTQFLSSPSQDLSVVKTLPCCRTTSGCTARDFLQRNTERRTGTVYGAPGGKPITVNFDDIGLASLDDEDELPEVLRLLAEEGKWFVHGDSVSSGKIGEWRYLPDSTIVTTIEPPTSISPALDRLYRQFSVFYLPPRTVDDTTQIVEGVLARKLMMKESFEPYGQMNAVLETLSIVSAELLVEVREKVVPVGDEWHHTYGLSDLLHVVRGMCRLAGDGYTVNVMLAAWKHEWERVFIDRSVGFGHSEWMLKSCTTALQKVNLVRNQIHDPSTMSTRSVVDDSMGPLHELELYLRTKHLRLCDLFTMCANGCTRFEVWSTLTGDQLRITKDQFAVGLAYVKFLDEKPETRDKMVEYVFSPSNMRPATSLSGMMNRPSTTDTASSPTGLSLTKKAAVDEVPPEPTITYLELRATAIKQRKQSIESRPTGPPEKKPAHHNLSVKAPPTKRHTSVAQLHALNVSAVDVDLLPTILIDFMDPPGIGMTVPRLAGEKNECYMTHTMDDAIVQAEAYLRSFNGHASPIARPLRLTRTLTAHFLRVARALSIPTTSAILVGENELGISSITRFAAHVADYTMEVVDCTTEGTFSNDMRALFRKTGCKGERVAAYIYGDNLSDGVYEKLNSFLATGEIYDLFSTSEMDALFEGLQVTIKKEGSTLSATQMFSGRVRDNLHLVISFRAFDATLQKLAIKFPSLFSVCYVDWFDDGVSGPSFVERGISFGREMSLLSPFSVDVQEAISHLFATSHLAAAATMQEVLPCLSPAAFDSFIECFLRMFVGCKQVHDAKMSRLQSAINTCEGTRDNIRGIENKLLDNAAELKAAEVSSAAKLQELLAAAAEAETAAVQDDEVDSQDDEELLAAFVAKQRKQKTGPSTVAREPAEKTLAADEATLAEARKQVKIWQAKITPKRTDALRSMKEPPPTVRTVVDMVVIVLHKGLDTDVYARRGKDKFVDSWNVTRSVIMDARFQQLIEDYNPDLMDPEVLEFLEPYLAMPEINSAKIRHAARECYVMYEWITRVVEYAQLARHSAISDAPRMVIRTAPSDTTAAETLARLQEEFDLMVQNKQDLEQKRAKLHSRLRLAQQLDASFGRDVADWKASISDNGSEDEDEVRLLCNCAVAAAYVAYAGAMPDVHRAAYVAAIEDAAGECFNKSVKDITTAATGGQRDFKLEGTLVDLVQPEIPVQIEMWPEGDFRGWMTPNDACIILMQKHCKRWPLIVDPIGSARQWLVKNVSATVLTHAEESTSFIRELRRCLVDGTPVVIANADLDALWRDYRIRALLLKQVTLNSRLVRSIRLGQDELEYNDNFELYITTCTRQVEIPHDFVPYLAVVQATVTQDGLEHSLTHHVMKIRHPRDWNSVATAHTKLADQKSELQRLEVDVLELLGQGQTARNDAGEIADTSGHDEWIYQVSAAKSAADAAAKVVADSEDSFFKLAPRMNDAIATSHTLVAVLDVVISLSRLNASYQAFEVVFKMLDAAIKAIDADGAPLSAERTMRLFIQNVYPQVAGGMLELDCKAFVFLLALKTEEALGRVPSAVFDWFDKGLNNEATGLFEQYLRYSVGGESRRNASRRPKQPTSGFATVRLDHMAWAGPVTECVDQFGKYKSEWVGWRENKNLLTKMPHDLDSKISPLQTLMIGGVLRPARFLEAAERYSRDTLDTGTPLIQTRLAPEVMMTQSQRTPIYLLDQGTGADSFTAVEQFAVAMNKEVILLTFSGSENVGQIKAAFEAALTQNVWFMIKCTHRNTNLYRQLANILDTVSQKDLEPHFRFWVSSNVVVSTPRHEGHFVVETPQTLRWNLAKLLSSIPEEFCDCSARSEWLIVLHNICFVHCVIQARQLFGVVGSLHKYEWLTADLWNVLGYAKTEYGMPDDAVPLNSVRNFMAAVYTRHIADARDKQAFYSLLDSWLSSASLRQNFEFQLGSSSGGGYRAPLSLHYQGNRDGRQATVRLQRFKEMQAAICTIESTSSTRAVAGGQEKAPKLDQGRLVELCGLGPNARMNSQEATNLFEKVQQMLCRSKVDDSNSALREAVSVDRLKSAATIRSEVSASVKAESGSISPQLGGEHKERNLSNGAKTVKRVELAPPTFIDTLTGIIERIPQRVGPPQIQQTHPPGTVAALKEAAALAALQSTGPVVSPVVLCIQDEVGMLNRVLAFVRSELRAIIAHLCGRGYKTPATSECTTAILEGRVPTHWEEISWRVNPTSGQKSLNVWIEQTILRHKELERLNDKRMKIPSMWLGGLFRPEAMLAALRTEAMSQDNPDPTLRVDITARDHSHLREPPMDGIFVHHVNLDGAVWEGGTFKEPSAGKKSHLPVLHLTYASPPEATGRQLKEQTLDAQKRRGDTTHSYSLPAYYSAERTSRRLEDIVFSMDVAVEDLSTLLKWTAWSVCLTL
jgi:energy-coupling factor transporter ATP-binding protein EcfA2